MGEKVTVAMLTAKLRELRRKHAADLDAFEDEIDSLKTKIRELKSGKKESKQEEKPKPEDKPKPKPDEEGDDDDDDDEDEESLYD